MRSEPFVQRVAEILMKKLFDHGTGIVPAPGRPDADTLLHRTPTARMADVREAPHLLLPAMTDMHLIGIHRLMIGRECGGIGTKARGATLIRVVGEIEASIRVGTGQSCS